MYLVPHHDGFDGQYYAHMALHPPWIYHDAIDHYDFPAYRIRRVFLPTLAWMLGFGKPLWIVHIYSFFNILSWLGMAWLLTAWLPLQNWVNFGRWAGCLLAAGVLESLRGSLTDLPSLLMMLAGCDGGKRSGPGLGSFVFSASVLTRDTVALSILGLLWPNPPSTGHRAVSRVGRVDRIADRFVGALCIALFPDKRQRGRGEFQLAIPGGRGHDNGCAGSSAPRDRG